MGVKSLYYLRSTSLVAKRKAELPKAKIITKPDCPYCVKLKAQLTQDGIAYEEVDRATVEYFPYETVPQLWVSGKYVGGYTEYMEATHEKHVKYAECEACSG